MSLPYLNLFNSSILKKQSKKQHKNPDKLVILKYCLISIMNMLYFVKIHHFIPDENTKMQSLRIY